MARTCGPDVTAQLRDVLERVERDFKGWSEDEKLSACQRVLIPFKPTSDWGPWQDWRPTPEFGRKIADIDGWDILPLYSRASDWLRDPKVLGEGCCAPTPSVSPALAIAQQVEEYEKPIHCSHSVQVGTECWLNGTVNYGLYGMIIRLCHNHFPVRYAFALEAGKGLIRAYKRFGKEREDPTDPIRWVEATYHGGAAGIPTGKGNRPDCASACRLKGDIATPWDYVWEPVKPRDKASVASIDPTKFPPSPAPPAPKPPGPGPAPPGPPGTGTKSHTVAPGDTLSKLAQRYYGNTGR
ncbi:MAG TPA: LysM domain-containing protein, partial [Acetobacteraceae bacterium]|nr:LysM domain-containing protein [Acetobacteraceae bacterium]